MTMGDRIWAVWGDENEYEKDKILDKPIVRNMKWLIFCSNANNAKRKNAGQAMIEGKGEKKMAPAELKENLEKYPKL